MYGMIKERVKEYVLTTPEERTVLRIARGKAPLPLDHVLAKMWGDVEVARDKMHALEELLRSNDLEGETRLEIKERSKVADHEWAELQADAIKYPSLMHLQYKEEAREIEQAISGRVIDKRAVAYNVGQAAKTLAINVLLVPWFLSSTIMGARPDGIYFAPMKQIWKEKA